MPTKKYLSMAQFVDAPLHIETNLESEGRKARQTQNDGSGFVV